MSHIVATGQYLPRQSLTNHDLIKLTGIDSTDEWIEQRTGIQQRYFADGEETVADMATSAAKHLLAKVDDDVKQKIGLIIVATMSSKQPTPSVANQVQANLGISDAWGFDISGACSGFTMALETANRFSYSEKSGYTLIIGAEKMSQLLDYQDRSTVVLFGDGAGAVLLKNDGQPLLDYYSEIKVLKDEHHSLSYQSSDMAPYFTMNGREVFNFVNRQVIPALSEFLTSHQLKPDVIISHQANDRLRRIMAKKMKINEEKLPTNIRSVANTSAASIPLLLNTLVEEGMIKLNQNQKVCFIGFGGGLAYGINYFKI